MKKLINSVHLEGYLYQHNLELKTSGENSKNPGTQYIAGSIDIATDAECVNIVPVHFTYTTATYATSGKTNETFNTLKNIIDKVHKTVMEHGIENASKVKVDTALGLNEFFTTNRQTQEEEFVSVKRNEGGFVHIVANVDDDASQHNKFDVDMVITNVRHIEADDEKGTPEKAIVKGAIFDFRKSLLPVELSVVNPNAIAYFEDLGATNSNPVFTRVKGRQISEVVIKKITEESAFGEPSVREVKNTRKDFVITWAAKEPYEWDDEGSMTAQEFAEIIAARETHLATLKQRNEEYKASKASTSAPAAGGFDF